MHKIFQTNFKNKLNAFKQNSLKDFKLIKNNFVHKTAVINWKKLIIGKNNIIGPYVVIGEDANHPYSLTDGVIKIGNYNILKEFTQINLPTKKRKLTIIGDRNYLMQFCHIGHDCVLEDDITLAPYTIVGGNTYIMVGFQSGIRVIVHQNQLLGSYSMIGMGAVITKKKVISPGKTYFGKTANRYKKNVFGLRRLGIDYVKLKDELKRFELLKNN